MSADHEIRGGVVNPAPSVSATASEPKPPMPDEETDVWYGGYAGRAMLPSLLICLLLSALIILIAWWLRREVDSKGKQNLIWFSAVGLLILLWLYQLIRWAYRKVSYDLRLTTRRLFYDQGFHYTGRHEVALAKVHKLEVRRNVFERLLAIGRINIYTDGTLTPVTLVGISKPQSRLNMIRHLVAKLRDEGVEVRKVSD
jgi:membrane protein YdbS with pleckstrin-like domain